MAVLDDAMDAAGEAVGDALDGLGAFMAAIRKKESGGNYNAVNPDSGARGAYQFMRSTFRGAAREAGLNPDDWSSENQDAVARHLMTKYYKQTGSWRKVAQFWYAGPGSASYSQRALSRRGTPM